MFTIPKHTLRARAVIVERMNNEYETIRLNLIDEDGHRYVGRFTGSEVKVNYSDNRVFVTDDDRILLYKLDDRTLHTLEHAEDLEGWLDQRDYIAVLAALDEEAEVNV